MRRPYFLTMLFLLQLLTVQRTQKELIYINCHAHFKETNSVVAIYVISDSGASSSRWQMHVALKFCSWKFPGFTTPDVFCFFILFRNFLRLLCTPCFLNENWALIIMSSLFRSLEHILISEAKRKSYCIKQHQASP